MNKTLIIIFAALTPLVAMLVYSKRSFQAPPINQAPASVELSKEMSATVPTVAEKNQAYMLEQKRKIEEMNRDSLLRAQKHAAETTPESIRKSMAGGLKSKEKIYRNLMDSLNVSQADADQVLSIILERNIQTYTISMRANTESDFALKQLIRSGQGPVIEQARRDMSKIIGESNVKKIEDMEKQRLTEQFKQAKGEMAD